MFFHRKVFEARAKELTPGVVAKLEGFPGDGVQEYVEEEIPMIAEKLAAEGKFTVHLLDVNMAIPHCLIATYTVIATLAQEFGLEYTGFSRGRWSIQLPKKYMDISSLTLPELLFKIDELMPPIAPPLFDGTEPVQRGLAAVSAVEILVDATQQLPRSNSSLLAAYRGLEICYSCPRGKLLPLKPGLIVDPLPTNIAEAMERAESAGPQFCEAALIANAKKIPFLTAIDQYNEMDDDSRRRQLVVMLSCGCEFLNSQAQTIGALSRAFLSSAECRKEILAHQSRLEERDMTQEEEARKEILSGMFLHHQVKSRMIAL